MQEHKGKQTFSSIMLRISTAKFSQLQNLFNVKQHTATVCSFILMVHGLHLRYWQKMQSQSIKKKKNFPSSQVRAVGILLIGKITAGVHEKMAINKIQTTSQFQWQSRKKKSPQLITRRLQLPFSTVSHSPFNCYS